jgi:tripartite-type tricarboxylate transporter receptor subunit TctC
MDFIRRRCVRIELQPGRRGRRVCRLLVAALPAIAPAAADAQSNFPARAVHLIVPSSPGGGTDTTARILSPRLSAILGQSVVVDNRPGASTIIGMEAVARAAPDGHTMLIGNSTMTIIPSTHKKLLVDPVRDFAAVSQVVELPQILVAHPSFPAATVAALIALARQNPGRIDYAAGAYGGSGHLAMELFLHMAGIRVNYVPYKSGNAGLTDTLAGQVPLMMGSVLSVLPHVRVAKLRALGVTGAQRALGADDIPTLAQAGVAGYQATQWFGIFVPAATPREIVVKLHGVLVNAVKDAATRRQLMGDGAEPKPSKSPQDFSAFVQAEVIKWAQVVRIAGIKEQR